jgi:UDP-N-acetyl-D-mannosaminuronate dehydrogenase
LGAAFKGNPRTNDFRNSFTQDLINRINNMKLEIKVWDPTLISSDLLEYSNFFDEELDCKTWDIVVIGNNAKFMFDNKVHDFLNKLPDSSLIIDMWGITKNIRDIRAKIYTFGVKV